METPSVKGGKKRRLGRFAAIFSLVLAVLLAVLSLGQGWKQSLLQSFIAGVSGGGVQVSEVRLFPALRLAQIRLFDPGAEARPAVVLSGVEVHYLSALRGGDARIQVEKATLEVDTRPDTENAIFIRTFLQAPASPPPVPIAVSVVALEIKASLPQGTLSISDGKAEYATTGPVAELRLGGERPTQFVPVDTQIPPIESAGSVELRYVATANDLVVETRADLTGLAEWAARLERKGADGALKGLVEHADVRGVTLSPLLSAIAGQRIYFDRLLTLAPGTAERPWPDFRLEGLEAGPVDEVYLQGDFDVQLAEGPPLSLVLREADTVVIEAALGEEGALSLSSPRQSMAAWSGRSPLLRGMLASAPGIDAVAFRGARGATGADTAALSGTLEFGVGKGQLVVALEQQTSDAPVQVRAALEGAGSLEAELGLGEGGLEQVRAKLSGLQSTRWADAILGGGWQGMATYPLTGSVDVDVEAGNYTVAADVGGTLALAGAREGTKPTEARVRAGFRYELATGALSSGSLGLTWKDVVDARLEQASGLVGAGTFQAVLKLGADLAAVGSAAGLRGYSGEIEASGPISRGKDGTWQGDISAEGMNLILGGFSTPYDTPVSLKAKMQADAKLEMLRATTFTASMGARGELTAENARVNLASSVLDLSADRMGGSIALELLAARGYLDEGDGTLTFSGTKVGTAGGVFRGELALGLNFKTLTLPDKLAVMSDAAGNWEFTLGETLGGPGGEFRVGEVLAGGARGADFTGEAVPAGQGVALNGMRLGLFGGTVQGDARVGLLEEGMPFRFSGRVEGIDLARFTEEFQPPDVKVTGIVAGDITAGIRGGQLSEFDLHLKATEGVSVNRDMVRQILMSQQVGGFTGAKSVGKVLEQIVGNTEQRPFDSVEVDLGLEHGRIAGKALMKSKSLDFTVDIKADPEAILAAIAARGGK